MWAAVRVGRERWGREWLAEVLRVAVALERGSDDGIDGATEALRAATSPILWIHFSLLSGEWTAVDHGEKDAGAWRERG
jgi:hypothetical protein